VWTLPNCLSFARIAVIPILVYLLTFPDPKSALMAAFLFLGATLTDYLDGYLARRHRTVSDLGKILDPLADKLMVVATLIMLVAMDRPDEPSVPGWIVVLIVAREVAVTVIRGIALTEGIIMEAEELGKFKFLLQAVAVFSLLVHYPYWSVDFYAIGIYLLVVAMIMGLWSGVNYHLKFFRLWQRRRDTVN
jgi:CDP-diacylglycerol--glycerol-3-phosphate 3-phosphatidyltransferase